MTTKKFLGRTLNHNTMMWEFSDGSGVPLPEELRIAIECDIECSQLPFPYNIGYGAQALGRLFSYKDNISNPPRTMKAQVPTDIAERDWKQAKGITERAREQGTNSMLAERDYNVKCDITGDPLMVVHGVHIWFCKSHHQPLSHCEAARKKIKTIAFAEAVRKNDKTQPYEYGGYRHLEDSKNADGDEPAQFQRWLTPREIALNFIRETE